MIKIAITGAAGKMGSAILGVLDSCDNPYNDLIRVHALISSKQDVAMTSDVHEGIRQSDIVIDFTSASYALKIINISALYNKKIIVGTTGFSDSNLQEINEYARQIPIFISPNMSVGMYVFSTLVQTAMKALITTQPFDINILEHHHRAKLDAPSGTALNLAKMISGITGYSIKHNAPRRDESEIHISSVRGGATIGRHEVSMHGLSEKISLVHEAFDRSIYARGALDATLFMSKVSSPGIYGMEDLLQFMRAKIKSDAGL